MLFPVPVSSEQLIPCWLQSMWGLERVERGAESGTEPAARKRHTHNLCRMSDGWRMGRGKGRE